MLGTLERPLEFAVPGPHARRRRHAATGLPDRRTLLHALDEADRRHRSARPTTTYGKQQQKAFSLLTGPQTKAAFDLRREPRGGARPLRRDGQRR